jgi:predicted dehydrogenase
MARIGVIGTGWGARVQVPMFRDAGLEVVGIAGHSLEKTEQTAAELGVRAIADWRDLIALDIDLVTIVTPPSEHLEMASAALGAGKHVICEKPTALNAAEAERLAVAARSAPGRIAIIDHELRFLPSWREARRRVPDLGVRYLEVRYASPGRGDRLREWTWWSDAASGGGIWGAVGSHFVDAVRYLIGDVESVQALLSTIIRERPATNARSFGEESTGRHLRKVTSDDFTVVDLRLKNGVLATMSFSVVASGPDEPTTMTIHGEGGALRLVGEELLFAERGHAFARVAGGDVAKRPGNSSGGAFASGTHYLGLALKAALDEGDHEALSPAATFEDGLAQQRVLDAARRSNANEGRWEKV